jgi:hypothetical protein
MFLKELFYYSRLLFLSFVVFLFFFVYLNIKWGVVAFPINQYGMYSGKYTLKDTQQVYLIYADGNPIDVSKLAMAERDILLSSVDYFRTEKENNAAVFSTMKRVMGKFLIGKLMKEPIYSNLTNREGFKDWFRTKVEKITHTAIARIDVFYQKFYFKQDRLYPLTAPLKLPEFEP